MCINDFLQRCVLMPGVAAHEAGFRKTVEVVHCMYWDIGDDQVEMGPFCFHAFGRGKPFRVGNSKLNIAFEFISVAESGAITLQNVAELGKVVFLHEDVMCACIRFRNNLRSLCAARLSSPTPARGSLGFCARSSGTSSVALCGSTRTRSTSVSA